MNYIGSKKSLLDFLTESIYQIIDSKKIVFIDLFAGTGIVGQHFKKLGNRVIANDLQYYSYVLNKNYIENSSPLNFEGLETKIAALRAIPLEDKPLFVCTYLDKIAGVEGFIYKNYCLGGTKNALYERQYFSDENGRKVDAIRIKIENWKADNCINESEYYFLLASLLEQIDKVANTASVYGAFLKKLKRTAQETFIMKPAHFVYSTEKNTVYNEYAERIIAHLEADVLYLDPPYNHRQYAPNYHILETIAKYDNPTITGKTGLRNYADQKSKFCQKKDIKAAFETIIKQAKTKYIFFSYNNEGLMSPSEIQAIMAQRGDYGVFAKTYNRFKADTNENRTHKADSVTEYLHYVVCK